MLMVGAKRQTEFLALVSAASRVPAVRRSGVENVAARAVAHGKADAGANIE